MRFGKRSKGWAAAGRRFFGDGDALATADLPVLDPAVIEHEDDTMAATTADEPLISTDPTQRLLTALGRFQRQVQSAESGGGDAWADECMQQLISAIEIAIGEGWDDIREALTDTARILQTYEDAGRARNGLPFLQDSYEILCLMVGDLIVGNVRSGVLQKWRERYDIAVAAVLDEGLSLVDDDTATGAGDAADAPAATATYPPEVLGFEPEAGSAPDPEEALLEDSPFVELPEYTPPAADPPLAMDLDAEIDAAPFDPPGAHEAEAAEYTALPSLDEIMAEAAWPAAETESGGGGIAEDDGEATLGAEVMEQLSAETPFDALEPAAEAMDQDDTATPAPLEEPEDEGFILEPLSQEAPRGADAADPLEEEEDEDDGSDLYVPVIDEASIEDETPVWIGETEDASPQTMPEDDGARDRVDALDIAALDMDAPEDAGEEEVEATAADGAPAPIPAPTLPADPSEALLATAQAAMRAGKVADAKRLALQLAANMARLEAEQAADDLKRLEARLAEDAREIAAGEASVADCQKSLQDHEWHIGEREGAIQEQDGRLAGLRGDLEGIEAGIADLDAQIRALQERRGDEAKRAAGVRDAIGAAEREEAELRGDLESLLAAKAEATDALEAARARVAALQDARQRHEADLRLAEAAVREREAAVEEIERTLGGTGRAAEGPQADGLLF